jgi:hypothetical protein
MLLDFLNSLYPNTLESQSSATQKTTFDFNNQKNTKSNNPKIRMDPRC